MIDLGLSKMALIGVVALVVIGPEKLPKVARMAGTLYGRAQRYISQVKSEVSREIELEELRKMQQEVREAASGLEQTIAANLHTAETTLNSAWQTDKAPQAPRPPQATLTPAQQTARIKKFRRNRLAHTSSVPTWYKRQSGQRAHVQSAAARVARHRPATKGKSRRSFYP